MYRSEKKQVLTLLETIVEALSVYGETGDAQYLPGCEQALQAIDHFLTATEPQYQPDVLAQFKGCLRTLQTSNQEQQVFEKAGLLLEQIYQQILSFPCKLRLLFLPYIAQMWTALESVWKAASDDPDCEALVVPIPYNKLSVNRAGELTIGEQKYEALQYPDYVPLRDYQTLDLQAMQPDAIFIHNPYDDCNNLTRIPEQFYSSNLKKKTDCLVYSTYGIVNSVKGIPHAHAVLPAYQHADFIVVQSEAQREILQQSGIAVERLLVTGSPKIDHIVNPIRPPVIPMEWQEKFKGRKVFLLNTHLSSLFWEFTCYDSQGTAQPFYVGLLCTQLLIRHLLARDDCALLWRPHPLLESMLKSRGAMHILEAVQELTSEVQAAKHAVRDLLPDYLPAFAASDALFTAASSLVNEYIVTGKPIYELSGSYRSTMETQASFEDWTIDMRYLYHQDDFFHLFSDQHPREGYQTLKRELRSIERFIDMVVAGQDPLKEGRMDSVADAYLHSEDGRCGEKTYEQIKRRLIDFL